MCPLLYSHRSCLYKIYHRVRLWSCFRDGSAQKNKLTELGKDAPGLWNRNYLHHYTNAVYMWMHALEIDTVLYCMTLETGN
jgi:hypothetical protein